MSQCCQIRCPMRPPSPSTAFPNHICHWSIELLPNFLSVYPMHLILLLKALRCLYIALCSCKASCPKLHNQVD